MSGAKCPRLAIGPQPCRVERFVCRPQRWRCVAQETVKSRTIKNRKPAGTLGAARVREAVVWLTNSSVARTGRCEWPLRSLARAQ
ncbi:hypothetical protein AZ78_2497 [Lysobacter capsici AZ78]|uniref:Uncharacterized protein n=1 Tax=Lysobacter capsici AZ78 TaxID=1444315 RepID=A0A108U9D2_9GAMM|nr:hypothetical protein AZ78_2497 [Lysobacter capsici AZ78]